MKVGMWEIEMKKEEGFQQIGPTSYWNASDEEKEKHTGGCGPGKIGDWFVPDTMYGESVYLACKKHDWMYFFGQTKEDKKWADIVFLVNMTLLIISDNSFFDSVRLRRVMSYFEAVFYGGNDAFDKGETMKGNAT